MPLGHPNVTVKITNGLFIFHASEASTVNVQVQNMPGMPYGQSSPAGDSCETC